LLFSINATLGHYPSWRDTNFINYTGYVRDVQKSDSVKLYGVVGRQAQASARYLGTLAPEWGLPRNSEESCRL